MSYESNGTFKWKSSRTIKMETLTLQRLKKCKGKTKKVKKSCNIHGKPFGRDEKPQVSEGEEYPSFFTQCWCSSQRKPPFPSFFGELKPKMKGWPFCLEQRVFLCRRRKECGYKRNEESRKISFLYKSLDGANSKDVTLWNLMSVCQARKTKRCQNG